MISKKICLLGSFAVGKTSLVRRFMDGGFSEKYLTTIGVKIDKKSVVVDATTLQFVIWDIEGRDTFTDLRSSYLRGASGYFLVADATRPDTLGTISEIHTIVERYLGKQPFVVLLNKSDLEEEQLISLDQARSQLPADWTLISTSAKTGANVDSAFDALARKILGLQGVKHE